MKTEKIKILNLYPDLANLYGDSGNVKILVDYMGEEGLEVQVDRLELGQDLPEEAYDLYYMGSSTEGNSKLILGELSKFGDKIKDLIEAGHHFIFTGNAMEILGKGIIVEGKTAEGLGIFDFNTKALHKRWSNEVIFQDGQGRDILGYQNLANMADKTPYPLFKVLKGLGAGSSRLPEKTAPDQTESTQPIIDEGIKYKNLRASSVIGPLLARNYFLAEDLVREIMKEKDLEYREIDHTYDKKAYEDFREILHRPGRQHG